MKIEHIAIWTRNIEGLKDFYIKYFNAISSDIYHNQKNKFYSYFLSFDEGTRLELMQMEGIPTNKNDIKDQYLGLIHFAIAVGSIEAVDSLTKIISNDGYEIIGQPRRTGDGYYESIILDPDGNRIEIMA